MVAKELVARGDEVTILDKDPETFRRLSEQPRLRMIVANGTSNEELRRTGVQEIDVFMALTAQDTVNALAAQTAQIGYGIEKVICRINDPVRREMYEEFGLRTVSPPQATTALVLEAMER